MISRNKLILEIRNKFPTIRKPEDYADIISEGIRLKALDSDSSRRKSEFRKIKTHAFSKSHKDLKLTIKIDKADHSISPVAERDTVVFDFNKAQIILNREKGFLMKHISNDDQVKNISVKTLKLQQNSITSIKNKLDEGNIFKQGNTYEKVFNILQDNKIKSTGYLWFGVRPISIPKYYLSNKAKNMESKT